MRCVEFGADGVGLLAGVCLARMNLGREGCSRLGKCCGSTSVQNASALAVSVDRHRDDGAHSTVLDNLHAGGFHEGSGPVCTNPATAGEGIG